MAEKNVLQIVLEAIDKSLTTTVEGANAAMDSLEKSVQANVKTFDAFKQTGLALTATAAAGAAAIYTLVDAFNAQERAETRLEQIATEVTGATEAQIQSMKNYASALQEVGVVGDEVIISGMSQLSSFSLQADQVEQLSSGLTDLIVANKGVNATQEDAIQAANQVGKAISSGLLGPLKLSGVMLTEQQEALFRVANEQERVNILTEVLAQNYGGLNEAMALTTEGAIQQAKNAFGDLKETLGAALAPTIVQIANVVKDLSERFQELSPGTKDLIAKALLFTTAFAGIAGPILLVIGLIPTLVTGLSSLVTVLTVLTGPIGLVIAAVAALFLAWQTNFLGIRDIVTTVISFISETISNGMAFIQERFGGSLERIQSFWESNGEAIIAGANLVIDFLKTVFLAAWEYVGDSIEGIMTAVEAGVSLAINLISGGLEILIALLQGDFAGAWELAGQTVENVSNDMAKVFGITKENIIRDVLSIIDAINKIPTVSIPVPTSMVESALTASSAELSLQPSNSSLATPGTNSMGKTVNNNVNISVQVDGSTGADGVSIADEIENRLTRNAQLQSLGSA